MEKIKINDLSFIYPKNDVPALNDINLSINSGEFTVICGRSGCGKSTLLRQLKPILSPVGSRSGNILFDGRNINELSAAEQASEIGFVLQNPESQIVCDKVWHELSFGLESLSCHDDEIRLRVAEMVSFFGLEDKLHSNVTELSGGQKQLLNLAAVMVMQPQVLILDEPTSRLDPIAAHDFLEAVSRINRELGTTVIISEQRLDEVLPLCDKVAVMEGGGILTVGTPREVGAELNSRHSDMLDALPSPMKISYAAGDGSETPVTIREGREWLTRIPVKNKISSLSADSDSPDDYVLCIDEAWFRYEKNDADILKGISFKLRRGELYALMGGNGAGKTTALSLICGINTPYRGKIKITAGMKTAALPQEPQTLFSQKTVRLDLSEMLPKNPSHSDAERLRQTAELCGLCELLDRHPYDLSGGEQQRSALAKVLLSEPDILILDEPTKGLDAHFKKEFSAILSELKRRGVSILMVSHDIEFCAEYADRCGMLFDGRIVSENVPKKFFYDNAFYTTSARRMARGIIENAVTDKDIIHAIGDNNSQKSESEKNFFKEPDDKNKNTIKMGLPPQAVPLPHKIPKKTWLEAIIVLLLIPLTVFFGMTYLQDRKYYFISLLIILEAMIPFAVVFEGRRPQSRELVVVSVLCAVAVIGRAAFAFIPQFKPVAAIVIISAVCFGGETGFLVGAVSAFVSNFFFGQGPWTPWQMFSFGIIGFIAGVLYQTGILRKSRMSLCLFGFLSAAFIYGGIMNPASVVIWQSSPTKEMFVSAYAMGLPFDLIHGASTAIFLWLGAIPMGEMLDRVKTKYNML